MTGVQTCALPISPTAAYHDGARLLALIAAEDGSWLEKRGGADPHALGLELAAIAAAR